MLLCIVPRRAWEHEARVPGTTSIPDAWRRSSLTASQGGYLVPASEAEHAIEIKRSRFLCLIRRVSSEEDARALVAARRRLHPDARHTCSAFVLGPGRQVARSSDDGEPAGTAGMPMLEALMRWDHGAPLSDTQAVVTRWFGGVKLGTGGLTRAYSQAVTEALGNTNLVLREQRRAYTLVLDYQVAGRVESAVRAAGWAVGDTKHHDAGVSLHLSAPAAAEPMGVERQLREVTQGRGQVAVGGVHWVDTPRP